MKRVMTMVLSFGVGLALTGTVAAGQAKTASQTSKAGTPTEKTQTLSGTVVQVEGNTLAVRMASGEIRMFTPPADRRFLVDGKELALAELQPGTRLKATVKETATPVTDRTVETLTGKVWYAAGPNVILTLENGENKMYHVPANSPVKFRDRNGKEITVFDLKKDMNVTATRITEAPRTEFATAVAVTGTAPAARASGAPAPTSGASGAPAARPAPPPPPAAAPTTGAAEPRKLPKTASPLPLVGLAGLVSLLSGAVLTVRRRRQGR